MSAIFSPSPLRSPVLNTALSAPDPLRLTSGEHRTGSSRLKTTTRSPNDTMSKESEPPRSTHEENGRRYGRYDYLFPVDQKEMERLDVYHQAFFNAEEHRLYTAPVGLRKKGAPVGRENNGHRGSENSEITLNRRGRVLDLGTGTGLWAITLAQEYDTFVFGVDLHDDMQPSEILKTTYFSGHINIEDKWDGIYHFVDWASNQRRSQNEPDSDIDPKNWDLIHMRMLLGSIRSWPPLYRRILEHLAPGTGFIEHVEIDWTPRSDDGTLPRESESHFAKWVNMMHEATEKAGRSMKVDPNTSNMLRDAGFVDVKEEKFKLYHNPWKTTGNEEQVGRWFNLAISVGIEGMSLRPLTRYMGMSHDEAEDLWRKARYETCMLKHHGYCNIHVWTARRPSPGEANSKLPSLNSNNGGKGASGAGGDSGNGSRSSSRSHHRGQ